jgi:hypothetical protein
VATYPLPLARLEVGQEPPHGGQPALAQVVGVAEVAPHEPVRVLLHLGDHRVVALLDPPLDLAGGEGVDGVAGDDGVAQGRGLRVEAGRAVAAAEDAPGEVFPAQREHPAVFVKGPPPGDHLVQLHPQPRGSQAADRSA